MISRHHLSPLIFAASLVGNIGCKKQETDTGSATPVVEIQDDPQPDAPPPAVEPIDPSIPELKINKSAQVAILCYHDFVTNRATSQMRIHVDHFRKQMQSIKDAQLPVISLSDFIKWRRGEKDVPDSSVMITIDDGYSSTYHDAFPILKEFRYPFSIFLYKQYVNGGGRALTTEMIKELLANGGEIGSHSVSHPLNIARPGNRSPEEYEAFLIRELRDSKLFLEDMFMRPVPTYAHPGGTYTQRVLELGPSFGYEIMFSVNPAKATWDTPAGLVPRYVILGNDPNDQNLRAAMSFRGINDGDLGRQLIGDNSDGSPPLVTTYPAANATIANRRPLISVDVSKLVGIDPASVTMKIAGFGFVPCVYDTTLGQITYQVIEPLRSSETHVHVSLHRKENDKPDMISWKFFIDLVALYLPEAPSSVEAPRAIQVMAAEPDSPIPNTPTDSPKRTR